MNIFRRDKHRDKGHKSEHRDKEKHHSSKSSHKDREKKSTENGVEHIKIEPAPVTIKKELRDPLNTSDYALSEANVIQANGIRDCFVNMSQISETSSCDYSMSQFRTDESAFVIKGDMPVDEESQDYGAYGNDIAESPDDEEDLPIAQRKKIKRELSDDDEDDMPLTARKKPKPEKKEKKIKREVSDDEDDYDKPKKKKMKKEKVKFFLKIHF